MGRFEEALVGGKEFIVTCELIPGRGHTGRPNSKLFCFRHSHGQAAGFKRAGGKLTFILHQKPR